jgi:cytochrome c553
MMTHDHSAPTRSNVRVAPTPIALRPKRRSAALIFSAAAASLALLSIQSARAQMPDVAAGRKRAEVCMACHGENGRAVVPGVPHLAGQNRDYLAQALRDYRLAQERHNPTMTEMAKPLSDADIDNIAGFFHGLRAER